MTVELVIFGCDGVLVDSEPAAVAAVRAALREFGFDPEIFARGLGEPYGKGMSDTDMWKAIGDHVGGLPDALIRTYERIHDEAMSSVEPMSSRWRRLRTCRGW